MPKRTMKCYRYAEKCVDENTLGENITNEWCLDIRLKRTLSRIFADDNSTVEET